jgi:signal peptidase I
VQQEVALPEFPQRLIRVATLLVAPALLSALTLRYLVPGRQEIGPGLWGTLARIGEQHPLPLGIGLFFLFTYLIRQHADAWWGDRLLGPDPATPASADQLTGGWKIAATVAAVGLAALSATALRSRVGQAYRVTSSSMLPTLTPTDHVLVNKRAYGSRKSRALPQRGDLVVFKVAQAEEEVAVKRVIGLPGDRITMIAGLPVINGWSPPLCDAGRYINFGAGPGGSAVQGRMAVEFLGDQAYLTLHNVDPVPPFEGYEVGPDEVFVLGDYRNGSLDSRFWRNPATGKNGAGVPLATIEGRVWRLIRWDRDGHLDWRHLLGRPTASSVHAPGMDTREVEARVAECLSKGPTHPTWPPPAAASSSAAQ